MLFSKNGSIPKPETDGTEGWIEVPDAPEVPEGKQLAWLNGEWVVRDPKPVDREGYRWKWNHDQMQWIEYQLPGVAELPTDPLPAITSDQIAALASSDVAALTSEQIGTL